MNMTQETEIKIAVADLSQALASLKANGFVPVRPRVFERNRVFDLPGGGLRKERKLLRLREAGDLATLTYKGVPLDGQKHKSREELETAVADASEMQVILERLGYQVTFIYEKFRTEFAEADAEGTIMVDETPAGNFFELEGDPSWIDRTAVRLGFQEADYVKASYGSLYAEWCRQNGVEPSNMVFAAK